MIRIPERLKLTKSETDFAQTRLQAKEEYVFINSYDRCVYLIRLKDGISHYKVREELRRTSYNLRKLIKENDHSELVLTSDKAYKGVVEDLAEGLLLSFYSFGKYKTISADDDEKSYPSKLAISMGILLILI